jgi:predicted RNA binding protein YcfA (HicA-like mRNA interferase family)
MSILAPVDARIFLRILERAGFAEARTGKLASCLARPGRPEAVTVPRAGDLQEDVVRQKLRAAGLMPTEYMAFYDVLKEEDSTLGR